MPRGYKLTQDEIIKKFVATHGNKYDYSLVQYTRLVDKILVKCSKHGPFEISARNHLAGSGCKECWIESNRHTKKDFIKKSVSSNGDKYDYSLVDYKNIDTHVVLICPKHGQFKITPYNHLKGVGCKKCSDENRPIRVWTDDKIESIFSEKGYKVLSINRRLCKTPLIEVICPKNHKSKIGLHNFTTRSLSTSCCGQCARNAKHANDFIKTEFAKEDYILTGEYINSTTPVSFICPFGHSHKISYHSWKSGHRCGKCAGTVKTLESEVESNLTSENYQYLGGYIDRETPFRFLCPAGHAWTMRYDSWCSGSRCPKCANYGFQPSKPGILYYVRFDTDIIPLYKIGITNLSVNERFVREKTPYKILAEYKFDDGGMAYAKEQEILNTYKAFKYSGDPLLHSGNTECFTKDVLGLDI